MNKPHSPRDRSPRLEGSGTGAKTAICSGLDSPEIVVNELSALPPPDMEKACTLPVLKFPTSKSLPLTASPIGLFKGVPMENELFIVAVESFVPESEYSETVLLLLFVTNRLFLETAKPIGNAIWESFVLPRMVE